MLVEWLSGGAGGGASTMAFLTARDEQQRGGSIVVIDQRREFYPPAAAALGLNVRDLVVVRPQSHKDALWAWEQSLRTSGATVIGHLERVPLRVLRRLKLAVEKGGGLALLLRPPGLRSEPSWADLRLLVAPLRVRGQEAGVRGRGSRIADRGSRSLIPPPATQRTTIVNPGSVSLSPWSLSRRVRVEALYVRGGFDHRSVIVDITDETASLSLVSQLA